MIEWTPNGILLWLAVRSNMFVFYGVLGYYFYEKHQKYFSTKNKTLIYSFCFISFIVGAWELPLFWFTLPYGSIWVLNLILYIIPFPIICLLFKAKFQFGFNEKWMFTVWCLLMILSFELNFGLNAYDPDIWNHGVSFIFRIATYISFFKIFKNITFKGAKLYE